jgi:parallel beta-helix repeat protein
MRKANMHKKLVFTAVFLMLALGFVMVKPANSQVQLDTIFIRPDGAVYPSTAAIQQNGNTYTFTDNIYAAIKIQKSNIVLNGAEYTLWGPYSGEQSDLWFIGAGTSQLPTSTQQYTIGVDLGNSVEGVVVENLNVKNFSIGMYIWTKNNTVVGNSVSNNIIGILLSGSNESVTRNCIANNQRGLFFGFNNAGDTIPSDVLVSGNGFEKNVIQLNGCECKTYNATEAPHNWDSGKEGNYWSNYNGTDANHDGIGDTPYTIDVLDQDRYPLMQNPASPTTTTPQVPMTIIIFAVAFSVIAVVALVAVRRIRKRT